MERGARKGPPSLQVHRPWETASGGKLYFENFSRPEEDPGSELWGPACLQLQWVGAPRGSPCSQYLRQQGFRLLIPGSGF